MMVTPPLIKSNLELDVLSAALAKLGIDVPATQVLEAIKEEVEKKNAEMRKMFWEDYCTPVPGFPGSAVLKPGDPWPEAHQQKKNAETRRPKMFGAPIHGSAVWKPGDPWPEAHQQKNNAEGPKMFGAPIHGSAVWKPGDPWSEAHQQKNNAEWPKMFGAPIHGSAVWKPGDPGPWPEAHQQKLPSTRPNERNPPGLPTRPPHFIGLFSVELNDVTRRNELGKCHWTS